MELLAPTLVKFQFRDVAFFVRARASISDRMKVEALTVEAARAVKVLGIGGLPKIGEEMVKLFVCGWEGVTKDGAPVPYSYDTLLSCFPAETADELIPALCKFVAANVDILQPKA